MYTTCSDTTLTHPHPYQQWVCRPLHRNPQPLPLTTRNSCEAKPYCLLLPCIKIFLLFFNLGFDKILAAENFGSMTAAHSIIPNPVYIQFTLYPNIQIMETSIPTHSHKNILCIYICSNIHMFQYTYSKYVLTKYN